MSIITTFDHQCRALASSASPDENASRFLVGTLSPGSENFIYLCEYKDDNNSLAKVSFKFPYGETWHLAASNKFPSLVSGTVGSDGKFGISLFKLPPKLENPIEDDYGLSESPIVKVFDIVTSEKNVTRQSHWHPDDGDQLMICNDGNIEFWDINDQQRRQEFSLSRALEKLPTPNLDRLQVLDLRWSSLFNCSVVAASIGSKIYGIDTRIPDHSPSSICWLIEDQKCNRIRTIDFNPNSQYYLASGGDDCRANFWDLRRPSVPTLHLQSHTHWIWSIRYNPFHDQLVLSAGSDARVVLMRAQSIASEPFGQTADIDEDEEFDDDADNDGDNENGTHDAEHESDKADSEQSNADHDKDSEASATNAPKTTQIPDENLPQQTKAREQPKDEVISVYEEHDDSVYALEWASDPWIFASLGFESRLVINKVPKTEKFNILF